MPKKHTGRPRPKNGPRVRGFRCLPVAHEQPGVEWTEVNCGGREQSEAQEARGVASGSPRLVWLAFPRGQGSNPFFPLT